MAATASRCLAFACALVVILIPARSTAATAVTAASDATAAASSTTAGPPAVDAIALMHRVAATYAKTAAGVVGVRSHSSLQIDAPLYHRRIVEDTWYVFVDGVLARGARPPDPRKPPVRDPYRAAYLGDYRFHSVACDPACPPGTVSLTYESDRHDVEHAYGTLSIELASARIVSQTETPYVLPFPTRSGSLVATWGTAAQGWFPLTIDGSFVGGIGPFTGHARYAQTLASYARYPTIEAAVDAFEPAVTASPTPR